MKQKSKQKHFLTYWLSNNKLILEIAIALFGQHNQY